MIIQSNNRRRRMFILFTLVILLIFISTLTYASSSSSKLSFPSLQSSRKQQEEDQNEEQQQEKGSIINLSIPMSFSANWPYSPHSQHHYSYLPQQQHPTSRYYLSDDMMDDHHDEISSIQTSSWEGYGMGREYDLIEVFKKTRGGQSNNRASAVEYQRTWWGGHKRVEVPRRSTVAATVPNPSFYHHRRNSNNNHDDDELNESRPSVAAPMDNNEPPPSSSSKSMYSNIFSSLKSHLPFHHHHHHHSHTSSSLPTTKITLPKLKVHIEPKTILKLRKTFHPSLPFQKQEQQNATLIVGANYNLQSNTWRFKGCLEDVPFLNLGGGGGGGGKLLLIGRELQFCKTWLLSVGAMEDFVTRLRFRAAVDLKTRKAYAKFGFRTERLSPINIVEGFTICKQLPLMTTGEDEKDRVKLEIKANFAFPEPEIEYSTGGHDDDEYEGVNRSGGVVGMSMGDVEINVDELNLLLDY